MSEVGGREVVGGLRGGQDARRLGPMHKTPDPRADVCLYFISPHRCKSIDVEFIAKLSGVVPVVPVLSKVPPPPTHTHAHTRTHARTHARTVVLRSEDAGSC